MEIAVSKIDATHNRETFEIHHLTDTHCDQPDFAEKEFLERVKYIAETPNAYWVGGGDYGSLILPSDPRFVTGLDSNVHRIPDVYVETVTDYLSPIRGKCLGFGVGNHEDVVARRFHRGVGAEVAMKLGIPHLYLGVRGWCIVQFVLNNRRIPLKIFQYHGWSAGRLKGRKSIQAERDLGAWNADVFLLGHDHQPMADIWFSEEPHGGKQGWQLHQRPRAYVNGGAWLYGQRPPMKGKTAMKTSEWPNEMWVEGRNFRPQPPAAPVLFVHVDFGNAANTETGRAGRAAGFDFEVRTRGDRFQF